MNAKQIIGIILILIGLYLGFVGISNIIDLIDMQNSMDALSSMGRRLNVNKILDAQLQMQGTSINGMWMKFGGMTVIGIIMLIVGILFAKKK
jgi:hypothetical protein